MSRAHNDVFRDTHAPHEVTVRCGGCGQSFITSEDAALDADRRGLDLRCSRCRGERQAPPQAALEDPTVDAVHDDLNSEVGPDAEPDVKATLGRHVGFGELTKYVDLEVSLSRGTESLGTVTARPGKANGLYLSVRLNPGPAALSDEAVDAIVSTLSLHTQLLIDVEGL